MDTEIIPGQMIPQYENKYFTQFYSSPELFIEDYKTCGLPVILKDESLTTLFYLLYARYGNSPIASKSVAKNTDEPDWVFANVDGRPSIVDSKNLPDNALDLTNCSNQFLYNHHLHILASLFLILYSLFNS